MTSTRDRVPAHTSDEANKRIQRDMANRVKYFEKHKSEIPKRLRELDREWDVERTIEANASTIAFIGVALGFFVHPYWLALPAAVLAFLFQHAVQGWCPPIPVLRRFGFRTVYEIEEESQALKAIRGDFEDVPERGARAALTAAKA